MSSQSSETGPHARFDAPNFEYLTEDNVSVPGQRFALVSVVGPSGTNQRNDKFGIKIRGCFDNDQDLLNHVARLRVEDKVTDIFKVEMGKWILIPPDPNSVPTQEYQEQLLNDIIKGYMEAQVNAKQVFESRVEAVKKDGIDKHLLEHERLPPPPGGSGSGSGSGSDAQEAPVAAPVVPADAKGKAPMHE